MNIEKYILKYIPLLAPVPTAWMVGDASVTLLHFPVPVAIAAACMVEGVGFSAINMVIRMREFNRHIDAIEKADKEHAPTWQALVISALYIVVVSVMAVVLHIVPDLIVYAPLTFIGMVAAAGWLFALSQDQDAREEKHNKHREQVKQEREQKKKLALQAKQESVKKTEQEKQVAGKDDKKPVKKRILDADLLAYLQQHIGDSDEQIAEHFGVTRQAIQPRRKKLMPQLIEEAKTKESVR